MKERRKMDMHSFLVKLLLPIYVVVSLSLVISHAKAIEHPRLRSTRSKDNHRPHIHVSVRPKEIDLYPGEVITIACRAKGGTKMEEVPFISFYRQVVETGHIPLSSGDPGILIEPAIPTDYNNEHKVKKLLTLGKFAWYTMEWGENLFYCKATDIAGHSNLAYFIVVKKWHDSYNFQRRRRRFLTYKLRRSNVRQPGSGSEESTT